MNKDLMERYFSKNDLIKLIMLYGDEKIDKGINDMLFDATTEVQKELAESYKSEWKLCDMASATYAIFIDGIKKKYDVKSEDDAIRLLTPEDYRIYTQLKLDRDIHTNRFKFYHNSFVESRGLLDEETII